MRVEKSANNSLSFGNASYGDDGRIRIILFNVFKSISVLYAS